MNNIQFGNLLVTIHWLSVLDRACAMGKLQAGLFRLKSISLHWDCTTEYEGRPRHPNI